MPSKATQDWLDKAVEDEEVVALVRAAGKPWGMAAYHIQQAAEKYIKAALVESGIAPPKSHDLVSLLALHPNGTAPASVQTSAAMTSAFAWLTRYPGSPPISEQDVTQAETDLSTIKGWAWSEIGI